MYYYLKGKIALIKEDFIVIDINGVAYQVFVTTETISTVKIDEERKIYTYYQVMQDDVKLYGFLSEKERSLFLSLITVNGVGPKMACQAMSSIPTNIFIEALKFGDTKTILSAKGIGKKMAERIVLELSNKLDDIATNDNDISSSIMLNNSSNISKDMQDAIDVLIAFEISPLDAKKAVLKASETKSKTEDIIKLALNIAKGVINV